MKNKEYSKMQIDTANDLLHSALRAKVQKETAKMKEKDIKAFKTEADKLSKEFEMLSRKLIVFNTKVKSKNPKLDTKLIGNINGDRYYANGDGLVFSRYEAYQVDQTKELAEINSFINGLKLGTALLADLEKVIAKIL